MSCAVPDIPLRNSGPAVPVPRRDFPTGSTPRLPVLADDWSVMKRSDAGKRESPLALTPYRRALKDVTGLIRPSSIHPGTGGGGGTTGPRI